MNEGMEFEQQKVGKHEHLGLNEKDTQHRHRMEMSPDGGKNFGSTED